MVLALLERLTIALRIKDFLPLTVFPCFIEGKNFSSLHWSAYRDYGLAVLHVVHIDSQHIHVKVTGIGESWANLVEPSFKKLLHQLSISLGLKTGDGNWKKESLRFAEIVQSVFSRPKISHLALRENANAVEKSERLAARLMNRADDRFS